MSQAGNRAPEQAHGAGDMRSGHRRATGSRITGVARVSCRSRAGARRGDIRFRSVAAVPRNRTAAAKRRYRIGAGIQSSNGI